MSSTTRLWDKNFNLIAVFTDDTQPVFVTIDDEDGNRVAGLLRFQIETS